MAYWKECTLSELGTVVGGATPSTKKTDNYVGGNISWITPKDLAGFSGRYISYGSRNITETGLKSCSAQLMPKNSILFSSRAPIGYTAIAGKELCTNQGFKSIVPNSNTDYMFLYYLLKYNKNAIEHMGSGTTFKEVSANTMRNIKVKVPVSLGEQRKIARILSSLDDKIEINTKINENLLQQIDEIYRSWYVDFGYTASSTTCTDLGTIPNGWHYDYLENLCQSVSITHKFNKGNLIFLNTGDIENGQILHSEYMRVSDMPGQAKKTIRPNDILYSEIRPVNKHFAYVNFPSEDYVVSTKLMVIRSKGIDSRRLYHFLTMKETLSKLQLQAESRSGTFPQIRFDNVGKLPILIADSKTEEEFIAILHAVYSQIESNNAENKKLTLIRDTLLPKLMSGMLDVSNLDI